LRGANQISTTGLGKAVAAPFRSAGKALRHRAALTCRGAALPFPGYLDFWTFCPEVGIAEASLLAPSCGVIIYIDRKSTRLNSSHVSISYAVFCLKEKIIK